MQTTEQTRTWSDFGIEVPHDARPNERGEVAVLCPKCSHLRRPEHRNHRCLSVNLDKQMWHCQHPDCGWSGGLTYGEQGATKMAAPPYGVASRKRAYTKPVPEAEPRLGKTALAWFAARGITPDVLARYGVYAVRSEYFPEIEREAPAICFPYFFDNDLVNVKYRCATEKTFVMTKGARKTFYNRDRCVGAKRVIVVEGEMDGLALAVAGIDAWMSVPNGANSLTPEVRESGESVFAEADEVVIAVDNDSAGKKLEEELARSIGKERCARVVWPDGCKDANDVLMQHGTDGIRLALAEALPYPIEGVVHVLELMDALTSLYENGLAGGVSTGWPTFDRYYRPSPGRVTVVTGDPGEGKSEFLDALLVNLMQLHGWKFGLFSPENHPLERHLAKLIAKFRGEPFGEGRWPRMTLESAQSAAYILHDHFAFIMPEKPTVDEVLDRAKRLVYRMGINGLVLDPWNQFHHERGGLNEHEYITQSLTRIQRFAKLYGVHVWIVAHPTKRPPIIGDDGETRRPLPTLNDISGSMGWYTVADMGVVVRRDKQDWTKPVQVYIQKVRFREDGREGAVAFDYDAVSGRYTDVPQAVTA